MYCSVITVSAILHLASLFWVSTAQVVQNGQVFTNGLAIVDAPQPNTVLHAGSYLNLAVDVSGNGRLPLSATYPYSNLPNAYYSLEFYLVSSQTGLNLTISVGNTLLSISGTSTVKHVSLYLSSCVGAGAYNLTAYETSTIRGVQRFSITSIPLTIQNSSPGTNCAEQMSTNPLQPQPQPANEESQSPWLDPSFLASLSATPSGFSTVLGVRPTSTIYLSPPSAPTPAPQWSPTNVITVTVGPSGVQWPITDAMPGMDTTVYFQPSAPTSLPPPSVVTTSMTSSWGTFSTFASNGGVGFAGSAGMQVIQTVLTVTPTPTQVTLVFVSVETITATTTAPGETVVVTSTATSTLSSMTAFLGDDSDNSQFLPVNSAAFKRFDYPVYFLVPLFALTLGLLL